MDQLAHFNSRGQNKQPMKRKLSQDEQDDLLILKKISDIGGLSSSDSFELINSISQER